MCGVCGCVGVGVGVGVCGCVDVWVSVGVCVWVWVSVLCVTCGVVCGVGCNSVLAVCCEKLSCCERLAGCAVCTQGT